MAVTDETFKFLSYGQDGPFGASRVVVDELARRVWYVDNEVIEGQIMTNLPDPLEWHEYLQAGAIRLTPGNSDIWEEDLMFDNADRTGNPDEGDKAFLIGAYLRKEYDGLQSATMWDRLLKEYNRGLILLNDFVIGLITL